MPVPGTPYGTGFYVSADGDVVTASHVLGDRIWTHKDGGVTVDLPIPDQLTIITSSGERYTVAGTTIEENRESWGADIGRIKTGKRTNCWLAIGDDTKVKTGDAVATLGFPALAFGSASFYVGIVSSTNMKTNLPIGRFRDGGGDVIPQNELFRVQMPISGGLSGAPVIDNENKAIAVVSSAGLWSDPLDHLIDLLDKGQLGPPLYQPPAVPQKDTLNLGWAVGVLTKSFHQYSSPGYGDSVPLSYLKKKGTDPIRPSSQSGH